MAQPDLKRGSTRLIDVARVARVSPQTVSNVINNRGGFTESTRQRVLSAVAETGYQPNRAARQLRTKRSRQIGFALEGLHLDDRMSTEIAPTTLKPGTEVPAPVKADRMPFGRWLRVVGWRHLVAIVFVMWALFPALYVITLAFSGGNTLTAACPPNKQGLEAISCIIPTKFSTANFEALLSSDQWEFTVWAKNSLLIATVNSFGALFMGAAAAYAFSRMRFTGRRMGLLSLMLVQMFPAVLAITAIYSLLTKILDVSETFGIGSIWGLTLVYLGTALGVNTFLMKGYFDTIPRDIDESARIDGAGHARIFFGLIMRLAMPILVVVFFVTFTATFNELPIAQVVLPDLENTTLAVGLYGLVSNPLIQEWGLMAAGGVMAAVPLFILFLFTSRALVTGLTSGAVKG